MIDLLKVSKMIKVCKQAIREAAIYLFKTGNREYKNYYSESHSSFDSNSLSDSNYDSDSEISSNTFIFLILFQISLYLSNTSSFLITEDMLFPSFPKYFMYPLI